MPSESQWSEILNASLRIYRSSSLADAGEEALCALKKILSTDCIIVTLRETPPSGPTIEPHSLQRSIAAGPNLFLHFKADYSEPVPKGEERCFDVIVKHVICASRRMPSSAATSSSYSANH